MMVSAEHLDEAIARRAANEKLQQPKLEHKSPELSAPPIESSDSQNKRQKLGGQSGSSLVAVPSAATSAVVLSTNYVVTPSSYLFSEEHATRILAFNISNLKALCISVQLDHKDLSKALLILSLLRLQGEAEIVFDADKGNFTIDNLKLFQQPAATTPQ